MAGPYHIFDAEGVELAGDKNLSQSMKDFADERQAVIKDMATGQVIYPEQES